MGTHLSPHSSPRMWSTWRDGWRQTCGSRCLMFLAGHRICFPKTLVFQSGDALRYLKEIDSLHFEVHLTSCWLYAPSFCESTYRS